MINLPAQRQNGDIDMCNNNCNSGLWIILILIILFGCNGFGGSGCGNCFTPGNSGCGCGC